MEDIHSKAIKKLDDFINHDLPQYSRDRNYDFGITRRNNVSMLSKYISHRIINEYSVVKRSLDRYKFNKIEKYIQEVFWRVYWKGWLEHRPKLWNDYLSYSVKNVDNEVLEKAYSGTTNIECFNDWVDELKSTNYLHNHTRMWFASIWIFTLDLPWQLGANFFMKHLYDGDAASNTLSWRWVAGLQTIGKHYVATSSNISKFTNGKYRPNNLNEDAEPMESSMTYDTNELDFINLNSGNKNLIIFENNLDVEFITKIKDNYENIYFALLSNDKRVLKLSENVMTYKNLLVEDISKKFTGSSIMVDDELISLLTSNSSFDVIYPFVGENLSFINNHSVSDHLNFIYLDDDIHCLQFCKKGFFNFKKNIPSIVKNIMNQDQLF